MEKCSQKIAIYFGEVRVGSHSYFRRKNLVISMKAYFVYIFTSIYFWYVMHIASGPLCMKQLKNDCSMPPPRMIVSGLMQILLIFGGVKIYQGLYHVPHLPAVHWKEIRMNNLYNADGYNTFGYLERYIIGVVNDYINDYFC